MADNFAFKDGNGVAQTMAAYDTTGAGVYAPRHAPVASAAGGATPYSYVALGSGGTNQDSQNVKGSAGQLYGYDLFNLSSSARYVKFYDLAAAPTSSNTPVRRLLVPAGGGVVRLLGLGLVFANGIGFRITTGYADGDTGTITAGDVLVNLDYH